jgi:predicted nucleotidyltransferase component of viral defense system
MITDDAIRALAVKFQTTELNVRREYFQHLFLSSFYQQPPTAQIYFKGGTALRMLYNSPRFSEDLDFSSDVSDIHAIEDAVLETLTAISRQNINPDLAESKTTSGGYLSIVTFRTDHDQVAIQVEISLRAGERAGERSGEAMTIVSDLAPAYVVMAMAREQLVDEEIRALLTRRKARDFYDLYFILRANLLPPEKRHLLAQTLATLSESRIEYGKELKEFLPRSQWAIIRGFPTTLEMEIQRFL